MIKVDLTGAQRFFTQAGPDFAAVARAHDVLTSGSGLGSDFTGWLHLPQKIKETELDRILAAAETIRSRSKALVVIGIGGSYLGARGAIELLRPVLGRGDPEVFFVGNGLSADALCESGTTLEPAIAFRIFRELLDKKYGADAGKHIFATTDAQRGVLKSLADANGWESFVVPDDVGGRFSVFSAVGLLPMAVAGIDVRRVITAAIREFEALDMRSPENPAWQYAAARQNLYSKGYTVEILGCYEPCFRFMAEWWKQLYGESEGKDNKGILPASVEFTADLHSMGQYIQQGPRNLMESIVRFTHSRHAYPVPVSDDNSDGLDYIAGRDLAEICNVAAEAVREAHIDGGVPNLVINCSARDEEGLAELIGFFELACALSGYMSGVNPFDQPGVEAYKKNMFRMLGKPGAV